MSVEIKFHDIDPMLTHGMWRWPYIKTPLVQSLVFAGTPQQTRDVDAMLF